MNRPTSTNTTKAVRKHQSKPQAARKFLLGAITLAAFAFLCFFISRSAPNAASPIVAASLESEPSATTQARSAYGQLPLSFEINRGQADKSVNFLARGAGYTLTLSPTEAVFALSRRSDKQSQSGELSASRRDDGSAAQRARRDTDDSNEERLKSPSEVLRMNLVGANREAAVAGLDELEGKVNYLIGDDPTQWQTNIPTFSRVRYTEVYPGIDVVYYGNQRQLEYDFVVAPGRDAAAIGLRFEGADKVEVDAAGDLLLSVGESVVRQPKPVVYQEVDGERLSIAGNYVVTRDGQVGFSLGEYDARLPLVIDPILVYSTYLGGSDFEDGSDIKVDSAGNAYICGFTHSTNFPTANAFQGTYGGAADDLVAHDAFVTKLNAAGNAFVYSTYLGGNRDDRCNKIAVDSAGNAYVAGETTSSTNFPRANAFQNTFGGGLSDAFVAKLNAAGNALIFSTYLGGDVFDAGSGIALDSSNNVYVTGRTTSPNFPTANAIQATQAGIFADAYVTKLNANGDALVYSTYLGGSDGTDGGFDAGFSIAVDSAGSAYVTGQTRSTNFPTLNPVQATFGGGFPDGDAFVTKINPAGTAFVYSTYLGGSENDIGFEIAVDSANSAYVSGVVRSTNFPTANAYQSALNGSSDAFMTKFSPDGMSFVYSTYFGGSGDDSANGIAVNASNEPYLAIGTSSTNLPTANPTQAASGGGVDAAVTRFNAAGNALIYSTYLGGGGTDAGLSIALDSDLSMYLVGRTASTNFPVLGPVQAANGGGQDAFITKISNTTSPTITAAPALTRRQGSAGTLSIIATVSDSSTPPGNLVVAVTSSPTGISITNLTNTNGTIRATVAASCGATLGANTIGLQVTNGGGATATANLTVNVVANTAPTLSYNNSQSLSVGSSLTVNPASGPSDNGTVSSIVVQSISPNTFTGTVMVNSAGVVTISNAGPAGTYTITIRATDNCGAIRDATFTLVVGCPVITVNPATLPAGTVGTSYNQSFTQSGGSGSVSFSQSGTLPTGLTFAGGTLSGTPTQSGSFPITVTATDSNGCVGSRNYTLVINAAPTPTTVQFSSSTTTNVQEACTAVQLTITRSGPTTGTTVIDYATTDGTAQQKSDYTIALGRLTFAPTETSKTITLLISEDSYVEGNETFTVSLSNATGGSLGTPSTATIRITDDATEPATNAIDDPAVFVCQQYHDLLMRQPEPAGMQFYLDILSGCQSTDTECTKYTRGVISANFFRSPEFQQKGSFVMYLYMITLGQRPITAAELNDSSKIDRPHYTEFMADLRNISDQNNDDKAVVSARKDALTVAWLQRPEIQAIFGGLTNEQFVKKLESTAGVTLANESTLIANLNNASQTRAQVLRAVAESPEVDAKFYKQAFVTMEYFGYLRRDPEDCRVPQNWGGSDPNQCGYIFHNNRFNSPIHPDLIENVIVRGFIESPEYRLRFGP